MKLDESFRAKEDAWGAFWWILLFTAIGVFNWLMTYH
jgi:hypothetical protein